jgi:hypothetical protein
MCVLSVRFLLKNVRTLNEAIGDDVLVSLDISAFSASAIITREEEKGEFETFFTCGEIRERYYDE